MAAYHVSVCQLGLLKNKNRLLRPVVPVRQTYMHNAPSRKLQALVSLYETWSYLTRQQESTTRSKAMCIMNSSPHDDAILSKAVGRFNESKGGILLDKMSMEEMTREPGVLPVGVSAADLPFNI